MELKISDFKHIVHESVFHLFEYFFKQFFPSLYISYFSFFFVAKFSTRFREDLLLIKMMDVVTTNIRDLH